MPHATAEQMEIARKGNVSSRYLAAKPTAYDPELLPERGVLELKADGIGLLDINGALQTLEGVPFAAAAHLAHELGAIRAAFGEPMMLHGEFHDPKGGFNAALSAFRSGRSDSAIVALWDAVTLKAWHGYEQSQPLTTRRALLQAAVDAVRPKMVSLLSWTPIPDMPLAERQDFVEVALDHALAGGFEGLVVKDVDSPYQRGPSSYWMKVKADVTIDVPVQCVREENGRVQSVVVTVDGKPCVVGSGIAEALRAQPLEFWGGRMVEIRYVGKTQSGALRGTSFVRFRDDKEKRNG